MLLLIQTFLEPLQESPPNHVQHAARRNPSSVQIFTLKHLGFKLNLVIKFFDKGSSIFFIDTFIYINKIKKNLDDPTT